MGPGDHSCELGQARIATLKARDRHDHVIVQEKLDDIPGIARGLRLTCLLLFFSRPF